VTASSGIRLPVWAAVLLVAVVVLALVTGGVGLASGRSGSGDAATSGPEVTARQLEDYVARVEPARLAVNDLLEDADPILDAYRSRRITPAVASRRMGDLEARFARQLVAVEAIHPAQPALEAIHRPYAHTYVLQDAYLSSLAAALPGREFDDLPDTQNAQRRAIITWRTQLEVLARRTGATLPADLQQAGRGEIAPSPTGS
jgi:hypothetical protein